MAKLRILSDEEFIKSLKAKYDEAKKKHDKLKVEFDIAEMAYQCINDKVRGGLDSGLATQFLFSPQNEENQMPMIEGLDTINPSDFSLAVGPFNNSSKVALATD